MTFSFRARPLTWFFVIAYSASWLAWSPLTLAALGLVKGSPPPYLHLLGGLGPMLAAAMVERVRAVVESYGSYRQLVLAKPVLAGKRAFVPGALDVAHSWTAISDAARTLVTVAVEERAWGKAWLVPTNPPLTVHALANRFASLLGAPAPKLSEIPYPMLWVAGLFVPLVRELRTTRYQFVLPFGIDSSLTERTFGLAPTDLDVALRAVSV